MRIAVVAKAIIVAVPQYEYHPPLPEAGEAARRLADDLSSAGYEVTRDLLEGGGRDEIARGLRDWVSRAGDGPTLILFWAGHAQSEADAHYLVCRDSPRSGLTGIDAIPAADIGALIAKSSAEKVLVIFDTCFSGGNAIDAANAIFRIAAAAPPVSGRSRAIAIISSAHPLEKAREARFTSALRSVLLDPAVARGWSDKDEMLRPDAIATAVEDALAGEDQTVDCIQKGLRTEFIPNPRFGRGIVAGDVETDRKLSFAFETSDHFVLASRGIEVGEIGWYFTGRRRLLTDLVGWLSTARSGLAIVTGPPGAGKSAIVGRLATLSSAPYRRAAEALGLLANADPSTLPREGSVDVAIHAKGKTLDDCARALAAALTLPFGGEVQIAPEQLLAAIDALDRSLTIIFDALDEAAGGAEAIARDLIAPLSQLPRVRVLVGTRRSLDGALIPQGEDRHGRLRAVFGATAHIYDLEDEAETDGDIADYVRLRLGENRGPDEAKAVASMAKRVAEASGGIFLYARVVSRTLRDQELDQAVELPASAIEAFVFDLNSRFGGERQRVDDLLRALAWGAGTGLSRHVWGPIATALSPVGARYAEEDVRWVLANVGWHIVETGAETAGVQQATYRLIHQAFVDHYQSRWEPAEAHRRIAEAISTDIKGEAWLEADHYLWRHLAHHAARGGALDGLIEDPGYLGVAEPRALALGLRGIVSERGQLLAGMYLRAVDRLLDLDPVDRMPVIHMTALMETPALAEALEPPVPTRWRCHWAVWRPTSRYQIIGRHNGRVNAVAADELGGRLIAASGGDDRVVRRWDVGTGHPIGRPLEHRAAVLALALKTILGRPILASGGKDRTIRRWDALTGAPIGEPLPHNGPINAMALGTVQGRGMLVTGGLSNELQRWDVLTGAPIGEPLTGHTSGIRSLAIGEVDGRPVIVSAGHDGTVRRWDAAGGVKIGGPLEGHKSSVDAVDLTILDGLPVIVSSGHDRTIRRWDAATGEAIGSPIDVGALSAEAIATGLIDGHQVLVAGSFGRIQIYVASTGEPFCPPLAGHHLRVNSVAFAMWDDRPVIISGGNDTTIRLWESFSSATDSVPTGGRTTGEHLAYTSLEGRPVIVSGHGLYIRRLDARTGETVGSAIRTDLVWIDSVAVGMIDGSPVIVGGSDNGNILRWSAVSGAKVGRPIEAHQGRVKGLALADVNGRPIIVSGGVDGRMLFWDARKERRIGGGRTRFDPPVQVDPPWPGRVPLRVRAVATGEVDGAVVAVSAGNDGKVRRWDAATGAPIGTPLEGHDNWVNCIVLATLEGRPVIVSGGEDNRILRWDARTGLPLGEPIVAHTGPVESLVAGRLAGRSVIISGGEDHRLLVCDCWTGELLLEIRAAEAVASVILTGAAQLVFGSNRGLASIELADGSL